MMTSFHTDNDDIIPDNDDIIPVDQLGKYPCDESLPSQVKIK